MGVPGSESIRGSDLAEKKFLLGLGILFATRWTVVLSGRGSQYRKRLYHGGEGTLHKAHQKSKSLFLGEDLRELVFLST